MVQSTIHTGFEQALFSILIGVKSYFPKMPFTKAPEKSLAESQNTLRTVPTGLAPNVDRLEGKKKKKKVSGVLDYSPTT